jgi:hypothetical protein
MTAHLTTKTQAFDQAISQLEILGYQPGDRAYVRCLPPKNLKADSLLAEKLGMRFWHLAKNKFQKSSYDGFLTWGEHGSAVLTVLKPWGETEHQDGWGFLQQANDQGYGVYYVVNPGGKNSAAITEGRSLFYECDGITKSEQWQRKKALERSLGKQASLVVETKKSLHVYFVLDTPLPPEQWQQSQKRLIQAQQSDACIHNPDRLMRLAGFNHWALDDEKTVQWEREGGKPQNALIATPVKIVQQEATVFTFAEFDKGLPVLDQPKQRHDTWVGSSNEVSEAYDIRNFASYLDGFDDAGRSGWSHAKCPHHNGESDDSLHIEQSSGAFKCHGGCNSKDVYHSALDLAQSRGYRLPEKEKRKDPQEPPKAEYNAFCTQLEEQQQIEALQSARLAETKRDHFKARTARIQAELNSLSSEPTITATGRYIPERLLQLPNKPGIVLVDGTMGVGKTSTGLKGLVDQLLAQYPKTLAWLFVPRNLLGMQAGKILGLPHHSNKTSFDNQFRGTSCVESIGAINLATMPWFPPIALFDEVSQTLKQILQGGTCKDSQPFIIERLRQFLKAVAERGGWIVLSEDGLTNLELDFVKEASGLEVVEHLKFTKEVITPRTFEIYDHTSLTWDESLIRLERGENLLSFTDSRKWLEETERMLAARDIEGCFFVHSGNSQEEWVRELMKNPTAWVEQNKPRFLGFTPSMGSGVSIDDPQGHFAAMAIHITHLEPREAKQGCDRLRTDVLRFGYVKESGSNDDDLFSGSRPDLILRDLRRNKNGIAKLTQFAEYAGSRDADLLIALQRIDEDWDNPESELSFYLKHWSRYKARENYSKLALRENLISIWESQGHTVNLLQLGKEKHLAEERTEHRGALDQDEAIAWAKANTADTSLTEARDILNTLGTTPERRRVARKRLLEDKLPGSHLDDAEFCLKAVIQHNGRFLKSAELLWKAQNPDAAKAIDRWRWSNAFSQSAQTGRIVIIHRLSNHSAQAKLLHECPLQPFIDGKLQRFDNNTTEAIAVHQWALLHNRQFRRHLRITVSENHTPVQTVNKLLRKLGFAIDKLGWKGSRANRVRQYQIANLQDCDRDAILKALTERFISRCEEKGQPPVIATRMEDLIPASCDHRLENWLTPECLDDVRTMWAQADSEVVRTEIRRFVPRAVLERAIA